MLYYIKHKRNNLQIATDMTDKKPKILHMKVILNVTH